MAASHETEVPLVLPTSLTTESDAIEDPNHPFKSAFRSPETANSSLHFPHLPGRPKYEPVWRRALFKIKAQKAINKVNEEILVYGTSNELTDMNMQYKTNIDELIESKSNKRERFRKLTTEQYYTDTVKTSLIMPNSMFKKVWNTMLAFILLYTALIMPFRIAFYDVVFWDVWTVIDFVIDGLFSVDVFVNFFSVQVNADGSLETRHRTIVMSYLKGWFLLDFSACLPFSLFDLFQPSDSNAPTSKYNTLLRLARLPRLYKLFRVVRIIKAFRHYRQTGCVERIQDFLQINSRLYKLIKFLLSVFVCVHVFGCFWYFSARLEDFSPDTWVVRTQHADDDTLTLYMFAVYWAITTCVTVGYGDITAKTDLELVICMVWMVAGVGFYSYTVGSLSSFLTSVDTRQSILTSKMAAIQEFAVESGISNDCKLKVRNAIRYNTYKTGTIWQDKHSLFNELPKALRYEVAISMYNGVARHTPLLSGKDPAFIVFILPLFRPLKLKSGEYLYHEGDHADEVYLITQGRINFVVKYSEIVYKSFLRGSMVGDVEVLWQVRRISNAMCHGICEFLVLTNKDLAELMHEFPTEGRELMAIAKEKAKRTKQAYLETIELLKMKRMYGTIENLAGQDRVLEVTEMDEVALDEEDMASKTIKKYSSHRLLEIENELRESKARTFALTKTVNDVYASLELVAQRLQRGAGSRVQRGEAPAG
jgi:hyperpolarization activated cyclic nucleotide-gated potassium channel 1